MVVWYYIIYYYNNVYIIQIIYNIAYYETEKRYYETEMGKGWEFCGVKPTSLIKYKIKKIRDQSQQSKWQLKEVN